MADTCRISCRLEVLPGERVIDRLTSAHAFGFDCVSLPGRYLNDYLDELRGCLADSPLPLAALSLGFIGSLCAELGCSGFNMPPVLICDNPERLTDAAEQDALLVEQLPALGDEAQSRGVALLIEPVNKYESEYLNDIQRVCF